MADEHGTYHENPNQPIPLWRVKELVEQAEKRAANDRDALRKSSGDLVVEAVTKAIDVYDRITVKPLKEAVERLQNETTEQTDLMRDVQTSMAEVKGGLTVIKWMGGIAGFAATVVGLIAALRHI